MDKVRLPLEVLDQLICHICGCYLSMGPIKVSSKGEIFCARIECYLYIEGPCITSLYNIIAAKCLFKCIHHYSGCEALLSFNKVKDHEKKCHKAKAYECPFCYFKGNGCELVYHFGKKHPTYMPTEDVLPKILALEGLANHVDTLLNMSNVERAEFMLQVPKICIPACHKCGDRIERRPNMQFCNNYHVTCDDCCEERCKKCVDFRSWMPYCVLDEIVFDCEWAGCFEQINFFERLQHKQRCHWRQYKCPGLDCDYRASLENIKSHWHLSEYERSDRLELVGRNVCMYWLPPYYKEIVYLTFELDSAGDGIIKMSMEDNVLPFFFRMVFLDKLGDIFSVKGYSPEIILHCDKVKYFKLKHYKKYLFRYVILESAVF